MGHGCICGGLTVYESKNDLFFRKMKLNKFHSQIIISILKTSILNTNFCDQKLSNFQENIMNYLESYSDCKETREKTREFWVEVFLKCIDNKISQFTLIFTICMLSNINNNGNINKDLMQMAKMLKIDFIDQTSKLKKIDISKFLNNYLNIITSDSIIFVSSLADKKNEFIATSDIIFDEDNKKFVVNEILNKYDEEIDLEMFFNSELDLLNNIKLRERVTNRHFTKSSSEIS